MHGMRTVLTVVLAGATTALFAERQPIERYQSIIDRQMFGVPPPGFDPTRPPSEVSKSEAKELSQEQEQIRSAIHFSAINLTPQGETAVGFTDNGDAKAPKHYYLKVGESRDGWTVKAADPVKATMTIVKDDIEVSLELGGRSSAGGAVKTGNANARGPRLQAGNGGSLLGRPLGGSLGERRRQLMKEREAAAQRDAEEKAEREQREALDRAEREQREAEARAEREEQQKQLQAIREELIKAREARKQAAEEARNQSDAQDTE